MSIARPHTNVDHFRLFFWTLSSFLLLLAWDYVGLDLTMAQWFGSASGFALKSHWLWRGVLHDGIRWVPWGGELVLLAAIAWPFGTLRQLELARRLQLALTTLLAVLVVSSIKRHSHTSCPWDLQQFGGVAMHVSHWAWGTVDGGSGNCFPAGHAASGFAFFGGFFAFRQLLPKTAWRWFAGALLAGFILGLTQQVRGAHYMSHTLWTAWFCWTVAALLEVAVSQWMARQASRVGAPAPFLPGLAPPSPVE